jgi:predicted AAA+ superfamily ATPase
MPELQGHRAWIQRLQALALRRRLELFPAVALLGPRQVGKTSLALQIGRELPSLYLDLEAPPIGPAWQSRRCFWSAMPSGW